MGRSVSVVGSWDIGMKIVPRGRKCSPRVDGTMKRGDGVRRRLGMGLSSGLKVEDGTDETQGAVQMEETWVSDIHTHTLHPNC